MSKQERYPILLQCIVALEERNKNKRKAQIAFRHLCDWQREQMGVAA
jgi:hypothetical protein